MAFHIKFIINIFCGPNDSKDVFVGAFKYTQQKNVEPLSGKVFFVPNLMLRWKRCILECIARPAVYKLIWRNMKRESDKIVINYVLCVMSGLIFFCVERRRLFYNGG